jgi:hypothetical protein
MRLRGLVCLTLVLVASVPALLVSLSSEVSHGL